MKDYLMLIKNMAGSALIKLGGKDSPDFTQKKFDEKHADKTEEIITSMGEALRTEVRELVDAIYSLSVDDQRLIIKGKAQNVALSLYNLQTLLNANGNIKHASRLAAYQFSDDFRKVSQIDHIYNIPIDACDFMNRCASFDKLSGWYSEKVTFIEDSDEGVPYIGATLFEPFVSSPDVHSFTDTLGRTEYLEGYFLSLFNACSNLIGVVAEAQDRRLNRKFAIAVENTVEHLPRSPGKTIYHIFYKEKYIEDWLKIDSAVYYVVEQLNNPGINRTDIFEMAETIHDIRNLIIKNFTGVNNDVFALSISVLAGKTVKEILDKIMGVPEAIELNRYGLHCILNEIRVFYEDLRIAHLKK